MGTSGTLIKSHRLLIVVLRLTHYRNAPHRLSHFHVILNLLVNFPESTGVGSLGGLGAEILVKLEKQLFS
jgi:hypothetical protein